MIQDIQGQDTSFQSSGRSWDNCKSSRYYQLALYCCRLSNSYFGVCIRKTNLFKNPWKIGYKNVLFFTKKVKMLYFFQKECLKKYHHQILYYWCYYCEERKDLVILWGSKLRISTGTVCWSLCVWKSSKYRTFSVLNWNLYHKYEHLGHFSRDFFCARIPRKDIETYGISISKPWKTIQIKLSK